MLPSGRFTPFPPPEAAPADAMTVGRLGLCLLVPRPVSSTAAAALLCAEASVEDDEALAGSC